MGFAFGLLRFKSKRVNTNSAICISDPGPLSSIGISAGADFSRGPALHTTERWAAVPWPPHDQVQLPWGCQTLHTNLGSVTKTSWHLNEVFTTFWASKLISTIISCPTHLHRKYGSGMILADWRFSSFFTTSNAGSPSLQDRTKCCGRRR